MSHQAAAAAVATGDLAPALTVLSAAYKRPGQLDAESLELEETLISRVQDAWRQCYYHGNKSQPHLIHYLGHKPSEMIGFTVSYLTPLFPRDRRETSTWAGFTDAEVEVLVARLRPALKRALAGGKKLNEAKLLNVQLEDQRRGLAELIAAQAHLDTQNRAAGCFMRAKDRPALADLYAGRLGERRPLLTALDADDWDEILRLWLRGWRPALEAVKIRLAARVDGCPKGGAIDFVTSY
jgi:hypothetical protein